ncbi:hypothetical protein LJK88_50735 [Paenibacillus sp. P26]|nr:hypothetical protein LJK88_50735 [Paenibacillus sp. P26]
MDWGRAKTILILSFLLLNMVLGFQLWSSRSDLLNFDTSPSGAAIEELQQIVKSKNIQVPADIPKDTPKLKEIVARFDEKLTMPKPAPLPAPFRFDPLISRGTAMDLLTRAGIPKADSYQFDPALSMNGTYVFEQMYGAFPMFEVQLKLQEKGGLIGAYQQGFVQVLSEGIRRSRR